jgi:hypothetical protein
MRRFMPSSSGSTRCPMNDFEIRKGRFPRSARIMPILISMAFPVLFGCIHIAHPSNVRPGWSADIVGGVSEEHYHNPDCSDCRADESTSGNVNVLQANVAWGKRITGGRAFRAGLMVPLSMNNGSALGAMGGTTLDVYYQLTNSPFNFGAGGMAGLATNGIYLETGKTLHPFEGFEMDIDMGVSTEIALLQEPGIRPFLLIGLAGRKWRAGMWADYLQYRHYLKRCDENCEADDSLERSVSGGIYLGISL